MDKLLYEGICFGGPLHGELGISRFPKGFLLVNKAANECWLYEWNVDAECFTVRDDNAMPVEKAGRLRAASESDYDVLAVGNGD